MAHSAGAPYVLSFADKFPERIRGEVLLHVPWVGVWREVYVISSYPKVIRLSRI
jgi:hypothetical protein